MPKCCRGAAQWATKPSSWPKRTRNRRKRYLRASNVVTVHLVGADREGLTMPSRNVVFWEVGTETSFVTGSGPRCAPDCYASTGRLDGAQKPTGRRDNAPPAFRRSPNSRKKERAGACEGPALSVLRLTGLSV